MLSDEELLTQIYKWKEKWEEEDKEWEKEYDKKRAKEKAEYYSRPEVKEKTNKQKRDLYEKYQEERQEIETRKWEKKMKKWGAPSKIDLICVLPYKIVYYTCWIPFHVVTKWPIIFVSTIISCIFVGIFMLKCKLDDRKT